MFDAEKTRDDIVNWIIEYFRDNGKGCNAVIGISGGKDSSIVAALCARALGKDRVIGVLMPNGIQTDIDVSYSLCEFLGIKSYTISIGNMFNALMDELRSKLDSVSERTTINVQPRLRMSVIYAVSQSVNGRVASTSNFSEDYVGYITRFGDALGDFAPIAKLTVDEVKAVGRALGLPSLFVDKLPVDGLTNKSDEENLGFTYEILDKFIRTGICEDENIKNKIIYLNQTNKFKFEPIPTFQYEP
ncbi:MAG: NH(3)-dependent NAD(+) synthetase [Firmicutes bacterium ADurb.Bin300]|jgi:NAD+ synthase|nr:MAG: NH(3)-dependent NAD(+) synthetase [Firmicutes bacterium ADurb.Bin300]